MYINYSTSSGLRSTSAQISSQPGSLMGIDAVSPSSGINYLTVYDSEDSNTTGKLVIAFVEVDAGMVSINHEFFAPVAVNRGIYIEMTGSGSGCSYIARYCL